MNGPGSSCFNQILLTLFCAGIVCHLPVSAGAATRVVNTLTDEADGSITDGDISLRDAVSAAISGDSITFDPALWDNTLQLTLGEIIIDKALTIQGPGYGQLTISGGNTQRLFYVNSALSITEVTLANGRAKGGDATPGGGGAMGAGGAILAEEGSSLSLSNVAFVGNFAIGGTGGAGGGYWVSGAASGCGGGMGGNATGFTGGSGGVLGGTGGMQGISAESAGTDGNAGGPGAGGGGGGNGISNSQQPAASGIGGAGGWGGGGGAGGNGIVAPTTFPPGRKGATGARGGAGGFGGGGGGAGWTDYDDWLGVIAGGAGGNFAGTGGNSGDDIDGPRNAAPGGGGAALGGAVMVRSNSQLNLLNCRFLSNTATGGAAGQAVPGATSATGGQGKGGAIYLGANVIANASGLVFSNNTASHAGDIEQQNGALTDNPNIYGTFVTVPVTLSEFSLD